MAIWLSLFLASEYACYRCTCDFLTTNVTVCVCHAELKGYLVTYLITYLLYNLPVPQQLHITRT